MILHYIPYYKDKKKIQKKKMQKNALKKIEFI